MILAMKDFLDLPISTSIKTITHDELIATDSSWTAARQELRIGSIVDYSELQENIRYLESLAAADAPVISCYLNVIALCRKSFNEQVRTALIGLPQEKKSAFWEILGRIEVFLGTGILPETRGVAIFGRGGKEPFFLPLQFDITFANSVCLQSTPDLSMLLEFRNSMFVPSEDSLGLAVSSFADCIR